jgi:predicted AAA+ superfamily ATPase
MSRTAGAAVGRGYPVPHPTAGWSATGRQDDTTASARRAVWRSRYLCRRGRTGGGLPGFWERLWPRAEDVAQRQSRALVLLDEAHLLANWAARLKGEWDRFRRRKQPVHIVATGSSALHLGTGSRESLAGRFERITLTHWSASSLADAFNLSPGDAVRMLVRMGAYPGAMIYRDDPPRWAAYVRDAIVEPAIGRDLLALAAIRKPALLRQVFAVCASSPAQIVSLQKIQGQLQDAGALETIAHYLELLEEAFLVAPLSKHSIRPARRRSAPPKLITLSNAFLAVVDPRGMPDQRTEPSRFGAWKRLSGARVERRTAGQLLARGAIGRRWSYRG